MAAVHSRYARAFVDVVFDKRLDPVKTEEELLSIAAMVADMPALRHVWENPSVPAQQKHAVLDQIVQRTGASKMTRNFIALLIDNRRIAAVSEIARQFQEAMNDRLGIADAEVTTARELSPDEKQWLEQQISGITGKKVRAHYTRDPKVLGGAVVRVGSTIYDGSVKGQLRRLKEALSN